MKKINKLLAITLTTSLLMFSCKKDLLNVPNENQPDFEKVFAKGEDVQNVIAGAFNTHYHAEHNNNGTKPMLAVAADNVTCSHGNFGMWEASSEPRNLAWNNSPSYAYEAQSKYTYDRLYGAIATANNVIKAIVQNGVQIGANGVNNDRALAVARFIQGVSYGHLSLVYDRAHVVDELTTVEGVLETALPYAEVAAKAVAFLEQALTLSNTTFTIPGSWFGAGTGVNISNTDFKKMINTSIARILSYVPRNSTQLAAVNWAKVKTHADAGITADWNVVFDANIWFDQGSQYLTIAGWGKADMYVVNMMDPTQPQHWTDNASFPHPPASTNPIDKRLNKDFEYTPSNNFQPARGYFNFSNYRHKRYQDLFVQHLGTKAHIMKAENDMLRAEARAYLGGAGVTEAATIINEGTRVTRGEMPFVAANLNDVIKAIHHERHVEMFTSSAGLQFFEMRKLNLLQKGTFLHFPIPAKTQELFNVAPPFYTFGTVAKADGIGTSNSGWR